MDFRSLLDNAKQIFRVGSGNRFLHDNSQQAPTAPRPRGRAPEAPVVEPAAPAPAPVGGYPHAPVAPQNAYAPNPYGMGSMPVAPAAGYGEPVAPPHNPPMTETTNRPITQYNTRAGRTRAEESALPNNLVAFPGNEAVASNKMLDAYVVNVSDMRTCRQAMNQLRRGSCVLIVMDQVIDKAEVRRYVDMLSGATFALGGNMTRLSSKAAFYVMAPMGMQVYVETTPTQAPYAPQTQEAVPQQQMGYQQPQQQAYQAPAYEQAGYPPYQEQAAAAYGYEQPTVPPQSPYQPGYDYNDVYRQEAARPMHDNSWQRYAQ